ncbi:TetR/AcrR family transcriptional regulator [Maledivibacter halophilus]|nr:TetR/AcrR family transcriptional regulator [Maledivibacter halophilus]
MGKANSKEEILKCAKKEFLKKGYKDASLRKISKMAGVTTGAFYAHFSDKNQLFETLVAPAFKESCNMQVNMMGQYYDLLYSGHINQQAIRSISHTNMKEYINYVYKYIDEFKLILMSSEGTSYANFIEDMVSWSVEEGIRYFAELKNQGIKVNYISKKELHILSHIHFSAIYEVVKHDMSKEEAFEYLGTITKFFVAGWNSVLGIEL